MFNYVGKDYTKYDGLGHVTGKTVYPSDRKLPETLVCKIFRSPYFAGHIKNLDISEALKVEGVRAIITHKDVPFNRFGKAGDYPVLAEEYTRFKGQPIAAVAATSHEAAMDALSKIKLDMEEMPHVTDPREAMKPDSVVVNPEKGNVLKWDGKDDARYIRKGDVEKGFAEADVIVEGEYMSPSQEQCPLETCSTLAHVDGDGTLVIYTKSQGMSVTLVQVAKVLGLPQSKIKLIGGTVGGAFGATLSIHTDHICGLLALKTRKPVSLKLTREEEFLYTTVRNPWFFRFKDGLTKDGKIIARQIQVIHDCGGYSEMGMYVMEKSINYVAGPSNIPNVAIDGLLVYTNKMPSGAMRGFGVNPGQFADQMQTEKCARALGMDPFEFRLINTFREGDLAHARNELTAVSGIEVLQEVAEMSGVVLPDHLKAMSSKKEEKCND